MRSVIVVLVCLACGVAPDGAPSWQEPTGYPLTGPDVVFSCGEENENALRWALSRWNDATGWSASLANADTVGPTVPVEFPEFSPDGRCGETALTRRGNDVIVVHYVFIYMPPPDGCDDTLATLTHELGHALCGLGAVACHSEGGVQRQFHRRGAVINQSTLDTVCKRWGCPAQKPELGFTYPAPLVAPPQ